MCVVSPFRLSAVANRWSGGGARGAKRLSAGVPAVEPGERGGRRGASRALDPIEVNAAKGDA